ncbi:lanthionine synthetase LanC family protein [Chitinophaga nivalis]|uniref:Lanthionine synthetase n=1 Tax=Chitinophaga nivalis TaxID=2991709 RepID=A0ABT3II19_9BACT|nr:lanthionine synthetase LanC family protein [Chitinophaga nivalis]MCW3466696.1 hypothetical protein [Chitinophaga nivalis]MCW3483613.1 hypothetical protein [Chitinophaga nivalis]
MMTQASLRQQIEAAVLEIADQLTASALEDDKGVYWQSPRLDKFTPAGEHISLFNGSAGIILFYLYLYECKQDPAHLRIALRAADRLLAHPDVMDPVHYTFYTGATAVPWLCIRLHAITSDDGYLHKAQALIHRYGERLLTQVKQADLLSGHAGNLLALTHLYAYTQNSYYLSWIHRIADVLIDTARIAPAGLKWDPMKHASDSLTGFSHGAGGIAFAWLQAGTYCNNEGWLYLAKEALTYEMTYYDIPRNNWMDLRIGPSRLQALQEAYQQQLLSWKTTLFYPTMTDLNTWAHGAAGSGQTRLYAYQLTGDPVYLRQALAVIRRCSHDNALLKRGDFTLCSGYGGIVAVLLQGAAVLDMPGLQEEAQQTALRAIQYYHTHGTYNPHRPADAKDPGLFSGLAGVGYLLLSTLFPPGAQSILHPTVSGQHALPLDEKYTTSAVKQRLFSRYYPQTIALLTAQGALSHAAISEPTDITGFTQLLMAKITAATDRYTQQVFQAEKAATELWQQHKGWLYAHQHYLLQQPLIAKVLSADNSFLLTQRIITATHTRIWETPDTNTATPPYQLARCNDVDLTITPAGKLTALLIPRLQTAHTVSDLLSQLITAYFSDIPATEVAAIQTALLAQIKELLKSGHLLLTP